MVNLSFPSLFNGVALHVRPFHAFPPATSLREGTDGCLDIICGALVPRDFQLCVNVTYFVEVGTFKTGARTAAKGQRVSGKADFHTFMPLP